MDCPDPELLRRLIEGDVVPAEQDLLEKHLSACAACRRCAEQAAEMSGLSPAPGGEELDVSALLGTLREAPDGVPPSALPPDLLADLVQLSPSSFVAQDVRTNVNGLRPVPGADPEKWPVIPGYEIQRFLGRGGMGRVYLARQERPNRLVALKLLRSTRQTFDDQLRFRNEADALARLKHPNIVQIYEVCTNADQPYLILELVEGGNLSAILDGTPWSPPVAAGLVEILARAVQHAHEQKIIHRDLKPGNILLSVECRVPSADADQGEVTLLTLYSALGTLRPKIADFGLAKMTDVAGDLTASGLIVGTPNYMAPEQARGQKDQIGPQTDIHALGAILYELLTGRPPFKGGTPSETLWQVSYEEPVPPSQRQPKVPRDLETICLKCLEKAPEKRYASAEALAEDLSHIVAGRAIKARRDSLLEQAGKWTTRHKGLALLLVALVPGLVAMVIGFAWYFFDGRRSVETEMQARRSADAELEKVRWQLYVDHLARARDEWQRGNVAEARRLLEECPAEYRNWEFAYLNRLVSTPPPLELRLGPLALTLDGAATGQQPSERKKEDHPAANAVTLSPDGRFQAAGTPDHTIQLRDVATGETRATMRGHTGPVTCVTFTPDGERIVSGSEDRTVRVWRTQSGQELLTLRGHARAIFSLAFRDGGRLVSTGIDGVACTWDGRP